MEISKLNFDPAIESIKLVLNSWKQRQLSLYGRNIIIKSLAMSKLTFLMAVLPNLDESFHRKVDEIFKAFLWDGKKPKIKTTVLQLDYSKGGIKYPNLKFVEMGMKLTWVKRLLDDTNSGKWKLLVKKYMSEWGVNSFWRYNIAYKDFVFYQVGLLFWRDVIKCWCHFNFDSLEQIDEPGNQIVWNNSHVKRGGKIIQYKEWERKGLLLLTHLQKPDGKIELWPNLADKFNLNQSSANIMRYNSLISAIPRQWKHLSMREIDSPMYKVDVFVNVEKV